MIKVSALFPNQPDKKFDLDYCLGKHIPLMKQQFEPRGLVQIEVDKGISAADPNAPPPFIAVIHLTFNSVEEVHQAFMAVGREVMGDIPNFTDVKPQFQISEIVS